MKITRISLRDFRGFPGPDPYSFDLAQGCNLLLYGENGSGKSSLFEALKGVFNHRSPTTFGDGHANVFTLADDGFVSIDLINANPDEYRWDQGEVPTGDATQAQFLDIARRAVFLDYRELLKAHFIHREANCINLFDLLVESLLADVDFGDGRPLLMHWNELKQIQEDPPDDEPPSRDWDPFESIKNGAQIFRDTLNDLLHVRTEHHPSLVTLANDFLVILSPDLQIELQVCDTLCPTENIEFHKRFNNASVKLIVFHPEHTPSHPSYFLNEARLTAVALSLFLASAKLNRPNAASGEALRLLVLDDVLISLDIAHRLPLLDILKEYFEDWQIFLFTHDRSWYEFAIEQTDKAHWHYEELYAQLINSYREIPIQDSQAPYLDKAWNCLQHNDYKAAGVYLRSAFERILRKFCVDRALKISLKGSLRDYKSEDFWPLVKSYQVSSGRPLLDPGLVCEINTARRYVLNPLCHDDPSRPNREEIRKAHASLERLQVLVNQDLSWRESLSDKLRSATRDILGDNEYLRNRALRGLAPPNEFALAAACKMIQEQTPALPEIALLLSSAFDKMLFAYCEAKTMTFSVTCCEELTTEKLWQEAKAARGGLATTQPNFVAGVEAQRDILLNSDPARDVCAAKTKDELETLCELFAGPTWRTDNNPCPIMASFRTP